MTREVVLTQEVAEAAKEHLLHHFSQGRQQEELCFGLWRQSTGTKRKTALVYRLILPQHAERNLHGTVSFEPSFLSRAIREAKQHDAGLAFFHSHPTNGWQDMSWEDIVAERDVISFPARSTGRPLVGLTIGRDGYWSARWWEKNNKKVRRIWCSKVRVVEKRRYAIFRHPKSGRDNKWFGRLRRTQDSWGRDFQRIIEELHVGIVGIGSVGCIAAEALARIGVGTLTLIDGDRVEEHNLDRLLYGTGRSLGRKKVDVAAEALKDHATNANFVVHRIGQEIQNEAAYRAALDCDLVLSCVDRPVGRDVLNYVAQVNLIPVIDGGVAVEAFRAPRKFFSAHWRAHIVTPEHQCLRCAGQYNSGDVVAELDGSLADPVYIKGLEDTHLGENVNTFPFALGAAGLQVNLALRYLLGAKWWPLLSRQEYQFIKGTTTRENYVCREGCSFRQIIAVGDGSLPPYLRRAKVQARRPRWHAKLSRVCTEFLSSLPWVR